jgi:hypothetical protein
MNEPSISKAGFLKLLLKKVAPILGETALNSASVISNYNEGDLLDLARENFHTAYDPSGKYADATQFARNMAYATLNPLETIINFAANPLTLNPEAMRMAQSEFEKRQREVGGANTLWDAYGKQTQVLTQDMFDYIDALKQHEKQTGKKFTAKEWSTLLKNRRSAQNFTKPPITRQNNFAGRPTWSGSQPQPTSAGMLNMMPDSNAMFERPRLFNNPDQFDTYRAIKEGSNWKRRENAMREQIIRNMTNPSSYNLTGGF